MAVVSDTELAVKRRVLEAQHEELEEEFNAAETKLDCVRDQLTALRTEMEMREWHTWIHAATSNSERLVSLVHAARYFIAQKYGVTELNFDAKFRLLRRNPNDTYATITYTLMGDAYANTGPYEHMCNIFHTGRVERLKKRPAAEEWSMTALHPRDWKF